MYGVLVTLSKLLAPFMPFISETMYQNLTDDISVHLADYPLGDKMLLNEQLITNMKLVRQVVELGHASRKEAQIKLRQPLAKLTYHLPTPLNADLEQIIAEELNVKSVEHIKSSALEPQVKLDTKIT